MKEIKVSNTKSKKAYKSRIINVILQNNTCKHFLVLVGERSFMFTLPPQMRGSYCKAQDRYDLANERIELFSLRSNSYFKIRIDDWRHIVAIPADSDDFYYKEFMELVRHYQQFNRSMKHTGYLKCLEEVKNKYDRN